MRKFRKKISINHILLEKRSTSPTSSVTDHALYVHVIFTYITSDLSISTYFSIEGLFRGRFKKVGQSWRAKSWLFYKRAHVRIVDYRE